MSFATNLPSPPPAKSHPFACFFDIDGTLLALAAAPDLVVVPNDLALQLDALRSAQGGALALVSGRTLEAIDALFPTPRFDASGQHGLEIRIGGKMLAEHRPALWVQPVESAVAAFVAEHPGLIPEYKGLMVTLHYRARPELEAAVIELMQRLQTEAGGDTALQMGKQVVELKPKDISKGVAIETLLGHLPYRGRLPIFFGDDLTDETGFAAVNRLGGVSVKIGDYSLKMDETIAHYRLDAVSAVHDWIAAGIS